MQACMDINLPDIESFRWFMINALSHDFYHDFWGDKTGRIKDKKQLATIYAWFHNTTNIVKKLSGKAIPSIMIGGGDDDDLIKFSQSRDKIKNPNLENIKKLIEEKQNIEKQHGYTKIQKGGNTMIKKFDELVISQEFKPTGKYGFLIELTNICIKALNSGISYEYVPVKSSNGKYYSEFLNEKIAFINFDEYYGNPKYDSIVPVNCIGSSIQNILEYSVSEQEKKIEFFKKNTVEAHATLVLSPIFSHIIMKGVSLKKEDDITDEDLVIFKETIKIRLREIYKKGKSGYYLRLAEFPGSSDSPIEVNSELLIEFLNGFFPEIQNLTDDNVLEIFSRCMKNGINSLQQYIDNIFSASNTNNILKINRLIPKVLRESIDIIKKGNSNDELLLSILNTLPPELTDSNIKNPEIRKQWKRYIALIFHPDKAKPNHVDIYTSNDDSSQLKREIISHIMGHYNAIKDNKSVVNKIALIIPHPSSSEFIENLGGMGNILSELKNKSEQKVQQGETRKEKRQ